MEGAALEQDVLPGLDEAYDDHIVTSRIQRPRRLEELLMEEDESGSGSSGDDDGAVAEELEIPSHLQLSRKAAQKAMDEISKETQKLLQNLETKQPETFSRPFYSLKDYIIHERQQRYAKQEAKKNQNPQDTIEKSYLPKLSFDIKAENVPIEKDIEDPGIENLIIEPPITNANESSKSCKISKKNSIDKLNTYLSGLLKKQQSMEKTKILEKEESESASDYSTDRSYVSEDDKEHGMLGYSSDHASEEQEEEQDLDIDHDVDLDSSEDELFVKEKSRYTQARILDSEDESHGPEEDSGILAESSTIENSSILDLLSGNFATVESKPNPLTSRYVDVEADEEDEFGQVVLGNGDVDMESKVAMENAQFIQEANEIIAVGQEANPLREDERLALQEIYLHQNMEKEVEETNAILYQLDHRKRDREERRALKRIQRKRKQQEKQNTLIDQQPEKIERLDEYLDTQESDTIFEENQSITKLPGSINPPVFNTTYAVKPRPLVNSTLQNAVIRHNQMHLPGFTSRSTTTYFLNKHSTSKISKLCDLNLEKERKVGTFQKLS
jgi:hypothetical protein